MHPSNAGVAPLTLFISGVCAAMALAQSAPSRPFDELRQSVAQAQAGAALQVRLRWQTARPTVNPALTENRFELVAVEPRAGSLRRDRAPQVSSTSLVVVSRDRAGRELDWRAFADPRVVRAEASNGAELTGERLYYLDTDLLLHVPDLPDTRQIDLYSVRSENGRAVLDPLGTVTIR
jgi:hypothetical protein